MSFGESITEQNNVILGKRTTMDLNKASILDPFLGKE